MSSLVLTTLLRGRSERWYTQRCKVKRVPCCKLELNALNYTRVYIVLCLSNAMWEKAIIIMCKKRRTRWTNSFCLQCCCSWGLNGTRRQYFGIASSDNMASSPARVSAHGGSLCHRVLRPWLARMITWMQSWLLTVSLWLSFSHDK